MIAALAQKVETCTEQLNEEQVVAALDTLQILGDSPEVRGECWQSALSRLVYVSPSNCGSVDSDTVPSGLRPSDCAQRQTDG